MKKTHKHLLIAGGVVAATVFLLNTQTDQAALFDQAQKEVKAGQVPQSEIKQFKKEVDDLGEQMQEKIDETWGEVKTEEKQKTIDGMQEELNKMD